MIDIHTHILPGLDDGPDDLSEALEMAREAVARGMRYVVATPHLHAEHYRNTRAKVLQSVGSLNQALQENGIPLQVLPGSEVLVLPDLLARFKAESVMTINDGGKYLLLEYPFDIVPIYADQIIFDLQLAGVTPILAHPERNRMLARNPQLIFELVRRGVLMQLTAGSITGLFGAVAAGVSKLLLVTNAVHFIASDAHYHDGRGREFSKAIATAVALVGAEQVERLTITNPEALIRGVALAQTELQPPTSEVETAGIWQQLKKIFK